MVWLVAERADMSGRAAAGVNHRRRSGLGNVPVEQGFVEILSFLAVLAANFEMNDGMRHLRLLLPHRILAAPGPTEQRAAKKNAASSDQPSYSYFAIAFSGFSSKLIACNIC
jgi:hypothetical protein